MISKMKKWTFFCTLLASLLLLVLSFSKSTIFAAIHCPPEDHPEATEQRWARTEKACTSMGCFTVGWFANLHSFECCCPDSAPPPKDGFVYTDEGQICQGNLDCFDCTLGTGKYEGIGKGAWTAIGCIPVNNLNSFVGWLLGRLIFVASGIAFLLMAVGAFQILTSAGTPEKVKAGKELITSALTGLIFIILSMFILKLIGVDILHLPEFAN